MSDAEVTEDIHDVSVEGELGGALTPMDFEDVDESELLPMHPKHAPGGSKTPQLIAQERRKKALALRLNGASYEEIAKQVGYKSAETCGAAIRDEIKKISREPANDLRAIQYERLNTMLLVLQPGVMAGDPRFVQTALSVMDRMNNLMGIAGEHEMEQKAGDNYLVVIDGAESEYIEALKQMAGAADPNAVAATPNTALHSDAIDANVVSEVTRDVTEGATSGNEAESSTGEEEA